MNRISVVKDVVSVMMSNMNAYPGLFAIINRAMLKPQCKEIADRLADITMRPMTNDDVDACMKLLESKGLV